MKELKLAVPIYPIVYLLILHCFLHDSADSLGPVPLGSILRFSLAPRLQTWRGHLSFWRGSGQYRNSIPLRLRRSFQFTSFKFSCSSGLVYHGLQLESEGCKWQLQHFFHPLRRHSISLDRHPCSISSAA